MEKLYTAQEVADYFRVKKTTVWGWFRNGTMNFVVIGRKKMVKENEVKRFIESGGNYGNG